MKKILALALTIALAVALAACGSPASEPSPAESQLEAMEARLQEMEQQVSSLQAQVPEPEPAPAPEEPQTVEDMLAESGMTERQVEAVVILTKEIGLFDKFEYAVTTNEESLFQLNFLPGGETQVILVRFDGDSIVEASDFTTGVKYYENGVKM